MVGDVQHTRHFVAVLGFETSCREVDLLHHIAVDDGQTLLLTTADEQGTIDLDTIDVHEIFVERTASNVVLAREFVVRRYSGLRGNQFLYGISRGGR